MRPCALVLGSLVACSTAEVRKDGTNDNGCTLGTAEDCAACGNACPGMDTAGTRRTCMSATCGILCLGEWYDVDGDAANGCEAEDSPIQDTAAGAVLITLPNLNNGGGGALPCDGVTNPCTRAAQVYGDAREHDAAPTMRPLGREDWYKVVAINGGSSSNQMTACLGITNFPTDNQYEVCIGNDGSTMPTTCMTAQGGGTSQCVAPPTAADQGTFYVKVRKIAGANTANKYALYLVH